jgi:hypothetical protein
MSSRKLDQETLFHDDDGCSRNKAQLEEEKTVKNDDLTTPPGSF